MFSKGQLGFNKGSEKVSLGFSRAEISRTHTSALNRIVDISNGEGM